MEYFLRRKSVLSRVFVSVAIVTLVSYYLPIPTALAATTISNNNAATQIVAKSEADFLVMDFNINVDSDTTWYGAAPTGGTAITATKPAGWSNLKFYDLSGSGAWNAGTDWLGLDLDSDGYYTYAADIWLDGDAGLTGGAGWMGDSHVGDTLTPIDSDDILCAGPTFTNPTCVYQIRWDAGWRSCGNNSAHPDWGPTGVVIIGDSNCYNTTNANIVAHGNYWSYDDYTDVGTRGNGTYQPGENLFIEYTRQGLTVSSESDTTFGGQINTLDTPLTATKPTDWTTIKFYDAVGSGVYTSASWVGIDIDSNGYYADKLTALTANLNDSSTIDPVADVSNVKFLLGGSLLGTASYDGGGSGWYLSGLNQPLAAGVNRITVTMSLNGNPSNNELVKMKVQDSNDDGGDRTWQSGDRGVFLIGRTPLGGISNANFQTVDAIVPTLNISMDDYTLEVGDTANVTFTFSEPVTGFTKADVSYPHGTLTDVVSDGDGDVYTAVFTPTAGYEGLSNKISVTMSGLTDIPGNPGVDTTDSNNYEIDTIRPTLSSAVFGDAKIKIGETPTVTFTFSEAVSGFTTADLTVPNGSVTEPVTGDGGVVWTAVFTPTSDVEDLENVITVNMTGVNDKKLSSDTNIGSGSTNTGNYEIDTIRPTLSSAVFGDAKIKIGETPTVTFTFSEAVSGFTTADLTVPNGSVTEPVTGDGGVVWTAVFTPTGNVEDLENVITVNMTGVNDKKLVTKSNTGSGDSYSSNYEIDTKRPTLTSAVFTDNELKANDESVVTFTFSEAIEGFAKADLTVPNGSVTEPVTGDGGAGLVWTVTFTPTADVEDLENVITVNMTGVNDKKLVTKSNTGSGNQDSSNYEIDTKRPTLVSAVFSNDGLLIGSDSTVTFTFSEAINGFANNDLTIVNGTLTAVTSDGGNIVWTATFTPADNVEDLENVIAVNLAGVNDRKLTSDSNTGTGSSDSNNYKVDTIRPTLVSAIFTDDSLIIDETSLVTFTFSEAITGFANADITSIPNGSLTNVADAGAGTVWTATFTPSVGVEDTTNILSINMAGINDIKIGVGNTGSDTSVSSNYAIDTLNPSFTMQYYSDSNLTATIDNGTYLKAGTYYIKITARETMGSAPTVTIASEGTTNDVVDGATTLVSGKNYKYTRVVAYDAASVGTELEEIKISGADVAGNTVANLDPTNEGDKQVYIDTVAPVVSAGTDAGTVNSQFTQDATATDVGGSGIASYSWTKQSGYYSASFGTSSAVDTTVSVPGGGPYVIRLTAVDVAGNSAYSEASFTWGVIPGGGSAPSAPSGVGSGVVDKAIPMSQTGNIGTITPAGVNYLSYINSVAGFDASVSHDGAIENHHLTITDLNLSSNAVRFTIQSTPQNFTLKLGEIAQVDLDGDKIKDVEVKFTNIWINRAELTVRSLLGVKEVKADNKTVVVSPEASSMVFTDYVFKKDLSLGMTHASVAELQKYLNSNGYVIAKSGAGSPGKEVTSFGALTKTAVMKFQKANNLTANGKLDVATRNFINGEVLPEIITKTEPIVESLDVSVFKFTRDLKMGMNNGEVKELQKYLNNAGFTIDTSGFGSPGNENTYFGKLTQQALVKFQKANSITPALGYFGSTTRKMINGK